MTLLRRGDSPRARRRSQHHDLSRQRQDLRRASRGPASACGPSSATWAGSASRKAATRATAAPAPSGSTASRSTSCLIPAFRAEGRAGHHDRGLATRRRAPPDAAGVHRRAGLPVRLLHGGHDHDRPPPSPRSMPDLPACLKGNLCRCTGYRAIEDAIHGVTHVEADAARPEPGAAASPRRPVPRIVTGQARYTLDVAMEGLLHLKVLRSPHAHARIASIDKTAALAVPGVARRLHLGGRAAEAVHHGQPRRLPRRPQRHLHAGQRRPLRRAASGRGGGRDRGRRRGRLPAARRWSTRCCPRSSIPRRRCAPGRRVVHDRGSERRIRHPERNILVELHGEVGDVDGASPRPMPSTRRVLRDHRAQHAHLETHCLHRLGRRARPAARPHQLADAVPHQGSALLPVRPLPQNVHVFCERVGGGFGGKQEMLTEDICRPGRHEDRAAR